MAIRSRKNIMATDRDHGNYATVTLEMIMLHLQLRVMAQYLVKLRNEQNSISSEEARN
jgi:hypothetical protein